MRKKTLKIDGMDCASCAMLIEGELEDQGVKARCSYVKQMVDVEFDPQKVTEDDIKQTIAQVGYRVI